MTDIHPHPVPPHILCSSITGNTRSLADALAGADAAGELDGGHFFAWSAGTGRLS